MSNDAETGETLLSLYVLEYFIAHKVYQQAIYAKDLDTAIVSMNSFYARSGLGNNHKSIVCNTKGTNINGIYYPPEKSFPKTTLFL